MARGLKLYDSRLAWALIAPTLLLLLLFLVLPIIVMTAYTFFTFVTAGVETSALTLANWKEFLFDTYYHGFLWKTVQGRRHDRDPLRARRLFSRLFHLVDDASGTNGCCFCC